MTQTYTSAFNVEDKVVGMVNNQQFVGRVYSVTPIPGFNTTTGASTASTYVTFEYVVRRTVSGASTDHTFKESELKSAAAKIAEYEAKIDDYEELIDEINDYGQ